MHDKDLALEILEQIYDSAQKVLKRFEPNFSISIFNELAPKTYSVKQKEKVG